MVGLGSKALLITLAAAAIMAAAVGSASARRLEISNQRIRFVWEGANKLRFAAVGIELKCAVILEGSFHARTISKVCGQLIGFITNAVVHRPCEGGGEAWALNGVEQHPFEEMPFASTLPWHIRYRSFTGTLPRISEVLIDLTEGGALVEVGGNTCLFDATPANPWVLRLEVTPPEAAQITAVVSQKTPRLKKTGGAFCPAEAEVEGLGQVFLLNSSNAIFVHLVQ